MPVVGCAAKRMTPLLSMLLLPAEPRSPVATPQVSRVPLPLLSTKLRSVQVPLLLTLLLALTAFTEPVICPVLFSENAVPGVVASARTATSLSAPIVPALFNVCVAPPRATPLLSARPPCRVAVLLTLTVPPSVSASMADEPLPLLVIAPLLVSERLAAPEACARIP